MENIIEWNDMQLVLHEFNRSHANGGRLGKFWVEDLKTGRVFLIKGSSFLSYEPFSEKIAYIIGKNLGMDVLEYDILPSKLFKQIIPLNPLCKYISICEKIDKKGFSITSVAEIKRARNVIRDEDEKPITNREVMYELLDQQYIDTMILFDAIIGNKDRHYGNVHLLRGTDGSFVGAPILDNGAGLIAQDKTLKAVAFGNKIGKWINSASMVERNHDKQIEYIKAISGISFNIPAKTIQILNELEPTFKIMPKWRVKPLKKYIAYRLHKYLGLIKRTEPGEYVTLHRPDVSGVIKEIEHT